MRLATASFLVLSSLVGCGSEPGDVPATTTPDTTVSDTTATDTTLSDATATDTSVSDTGADTAVDTSVPDVDDPWQAAFDHVFPENRVVDITLDLPDGDWAALLSDWQSSRLKNEYPAAFTFDAESLPNVAVRLKGLNSLNIPDSGPINETGKYPLKIDFNKLGGERFHQVDELALNTSNADASRMRDPFTARIYNAMGVDAARTAWADVTIEGAHIGTYVLAQVIDKRFLKERFGEADHADDGNLYKCVYNQLGACSFEWLGDDKSAYVSANGCAPGYEQCGLVLQTNEDDPTQNDYADLIHLIDVLNHAGAALETELPKVFDVDRFLRLAAVAYATSNFDSYFGKGHNYYLYRRNDGRFQMIPWDFDLAWGNTTCPDPVDDPTCGGAASHPLTRLILEVPAWNATYRQYLQEVVDTWLTPERLAAWVTDADTLLRDIVASDPNLPLDGSYLEQIDATSATGLGNLFRFMLDRRADILTKLPTP